MTKEITKAIILQEIQNKFKLRDLTPEIFTFGEQVVPVYDISSHLAKWESVFTVKSITSATSFLFFTVPENEQWEITHYNVVFMAAGAYTITGVFVSRVTQHLADIIYLDMKEGQTVSYVVNLPIPVVLQPNDRIYVYADGYTSPADLRLYINVRKEEIR